jgi:hypothetical protein
VRANCLHIAQTLSNRERSVWVSARTPYAALLPPDDAPLLACKQCCQRGQVIATTGSSVGEQDRQRSVAFGECPEAHAVGRRDERFNHIHPFALPTIAALHLIPDFAVQNGAYHPWMSFESERTPAHLAWSSYTIFRKALSPLNTQRLTIAKRQIRMEPFVIDPASPVSKNQLLDAIICEEIKLNGRRLFHKGHRIGEGDLESLANLDRPIHAVRLGPYDVHEDIAGVRLANAIASNGVGRGKPVQSRVNLRSERKGLLRVNPGALLALNRLPGLAIFSLPDRLPVLPGKIVAGAKITPVAIDEAVLAEAEQIASVSPVIEVKAFKSMKVGVVTTEGLQGDACDRFQTSVSRKVDWFGGDVLGFVDLPNEPDEVANAIGRFLDNGADLIMTGGGNTIDPLDATLLALPQVGGEIVKFGAPVHPGSMFWLAYRGETPIFNLASCSMYSQATVADLLLPWIMAGEKVTLDDMAGIGYGGLLDRDMSFRFPPYESDSSDEPDEG